MLTVWISTYWASTRIWSLGRTWYLQNVNSSATSCFCSLTNMPSMKRSYLLHTCSIVAFIFKHLICFQLESSFFIWPGKQQLTNQFQDSLTCMILSFRPHHMALTSRRSLLGCHGTIILSNSRTSHPFWLKNWSSRQNNLNSKSTYLLTRIMLYGQKLQNKRANWPWVEIVLYIFVCDF